MFAIVLSVCSLLSGQTCKDVTLSLIDEGQLQTPYACLLGAQNEIAKYIEAHPNWSVRRWSCQPSSGLASKA